MPGHTKTLCKVACIINKLQNSYPGAQLSSDGSGLSSSWHVDQVEVVDTLRSVSTVFPCNRWFDKKDPMSLQQPLLPRGLDGAAADLLSYEVVVYTSDIKFAGTDANVSIEIHGDKVGFPVPSWTLGVSGIRPIAITSNRIEFLH